MISFMFGVLGSVLFWVIYVCVSFVVTGTLMRFATPTAWKVLTTGEKQWAYDIDGFMNSYYNAWVIWVGTWFFLFWPVILPSLIIYLIFTKITAPLLRQLLIKSGNIIPEFEIKKKEN